MKAKIYKLSNGSHYIEIENSTAQAFFARQQRRVLCTIDSQVTLHSALMRISENTYGIYIGLKALKQLGVAEGSTLQIDLTPDNSPYQFEMPEVLEEVFDSDPDAFESFSALTAGSQRSLMYWVTQVKSVDKRIERALQICRRLKAGITAAKKIMEKD